MARIYEGLKRFASGLPNPAQDIENIGRVIRRYSLPIQKYLARKLSPAAIEETTVYRLADTERRNLATSLRDTQAALDSTTAQLEDTSQALSSREAASLEERASIVYDQLNTVVLAEQRDYAIERALHYHKIAQEQGTLNKFLKRTVVNLREALLRTSANNTVTLHPNDFVVAVDHHDNIINASPRAARRLGYSNPDELIGLNVYSFVRVNSLALKQRIGKMIERDITEPINLQNVSIRGARDRDYRLNVKVLPISAEAVPSVGKVYAGAIIQELGWRENRVLQRRERTEKRASQQEQEVIDDETAAKIQQLWSLMGPLEQE